MELGKDAFYYRYIFHFRVCSFQQDRSSRPRIIADPKSMTQLVRTSNGFTSTERKCFCESLLLNAGTTGKKFSSLKKDKEQKWKGSKEKCRK